jgi:hypothetical protein
MRVAKDRIDPVAWSHQHGLQRKTERQIGDTISASRSEMANKAILNSLARSWPEPVDPLFDCW